MAIYMMRDDGRQPWANTVAYYPLNSTTTVNDLSWNSRNLTNSWVTFGDYNWVNCASFNGNSYMYRSESLFTGSQDFTVNLWYNRTSDSQNHWNIFSVWTYDTTNSFIIWLWNDIWADFLKVMFWGWDNDRNTGYFPTKDVWLNIVATHKNWTVKLYVNWQSEYSGAVSYTIQSWFTWIWCGVQKNNAMIWKLSNIIVENVVWSATDVANYYNDTKANYWIS